MSSSKRNRSPSPSRERREYLRDDRDDYRTRDSRDYSRRDDHRDDRNRDDRRDHSPQRRRYHSPERSRHSSHSRYHDDSGDDDNFEQEVILKQTKPSQTNATNQKVTHKPQNNDLLNTGVETPSEKHSTPISLEDLRHDKEIRDLQASKPVFRSKRERKMDKVDLMQEKKNKVEEMRREREKMLQERNQPSQYDQNSSKLRSDELLDIKKSYYSQVPTRDIETEKKPKEKGKFKFEWDQSEDTSHDLNPIYDQKHESQVLFGRATRGGEVREEVKKAEPKMVHWSSKKREDMTSRDWRIFCEDFEIQTKGGNIPHPIRNWKESELPSDILKTIDRLGFDKPTPIQMQCIPVGLSNRDIMGLSETGSGKTFAYILPLLVYVSKLPKLNQYNCHDGPYSLILAPTRELALQIEEEARKFTDPLGIKVVSVIGGVSQDKQSYALREGCEILIATPGRLIAYLETRILVLNQCNYVVLDECDKMISMGFEEQVNQILDFMPSSNLRPENEKEEDKNSVYRQTIMFSATMPKEIERLANKYMRRKVVVMIGEVGRTVKKIEQNIEFLEDHAKRNRMVYLLERNEGPVIVFVNLKTTADAIQKYLHTQGYRSLVLHGKKTQEARNYALESLKNGNIDVLIATDVMSRGIDVEGIKWVLNYDMPNNIEDYKHRIGRTGRAGKQGVAYSFLTEKDTGVMYDLKQTLQQAEQRVPDELALHPSALIKPGTVKESILK